MLQTPILLLVFNRPEPALQVLEQIRIQQPRQLFIAADGPRASHAGEAELCRKTREVLRERIDWPCEVRTLYRDVNLGCGKAVSGAIEWFFDHVEEGIILEDDCIPDPTFFHYCAYLLAYYRDHEQVMHIGGSNFQQGKVRGMGSYYFSRYSHVWGWATWRRAWKNYDYTLDMYRESPLTDLNPSLRGALRAIYHQQIDTWDIQWFMSVWFSGGWAITPNVSLIRNIGYGLGATHTRRVPGWFKKIRYGSLPLLTHPDVFDVDRVADHFTATTLFNDSKWSVRIKEIIRQHDFLYQLYRRIS